MKTSYYAIVYHKYTPGNNGVRPLLLTHQVELDSDNITEEFQRWCQIMSFPHGTKIDIIDKAYCQSLVVATTILTP